MSWNPELFNKAFDFATRLHEGQTVPGTDLPYISHVVKVTMEMARAVQAHSGINGDLALQCALLHDTIEDTPATYDEVVELFGREVADGVLALTKDESVPKEKRMEDSLDRILKQPNEIAMVKLCDRITNLAPPPAGWSLQKREKYRNEAIFITNKLGEVSSFLKNRIENRIEDYLKYIK